MKKTLLNALVLTMIVLGGAMIASAQKAKPKPAVAIAGVYENFTVGRESGDLRGMRVVIVPAGGSYHAIVQIAEGDTEDPEPQFVPVNVKRSGIEFTAGGETFRGTATTAGLRLRSNSGVNSLVKRKSCTAYFSTKP